MRHHWRGAWLPRGRQIDSLISFFFRKPLCQPSNAWVFISGHVESRESHRPSLSFVRSIRPPLSLSLSLFAISRAMPFPPSLSTRFLNARPSTSMPNANERTPRIHMSSRAPTECFSACAPLMINANSWISSEGSGSMCGNRREIARECFNFDSKAAPAKEVSIPSERSFPFSRSPVYLLPIPNARDRWSISLRCVRFTVARLKRVSK